MKLPSYVVALAALVLHLPVHAQQQQQQQQQRRSGIDPLLGIHPSKLALYSQAVSHDPQAQFACLDGSRSIDIKSLNDDYCDCDDGSDESGTSACPDAVFYCTNNGHIGAEIPSSRVNDGVCDPECCDGSDEYSGLVNCPNTCATISAEHQRKQNELMKVLQKGLKLKQGYIDFGVKAKAGRADQLNSLNLKISNVTARIEELKVLKTQAEHFEAHQNAIRAHENAQAARTTLPQRHAACAERKQILRANVETLNTRLGELKRILDHLMTLRDVEEGAAFEALLRDKPILQETLQQYDDFKNAHVVVYQNEDGTSEEDVSGNGAFITLDAEPEEDNVVATQLADSDSDSAVESDATTHLDDFSDPCVDPSASLVSCLTATATNNAKSLFSVVKAPFTWRGWSKLRTSLTRNPFKTLSQSEEDEVLKKDASKARARLDELESKKREYESQLEDVKRKEGLDLGEQGEWDQLVDVCIDMDSFEYNYSICFLGDATQKAKNGGGGGTSLGKFSRWGPRKGPAGKGPEKYHHMMFEGGQHCWNGPSRSVEVALECGTENKILSVSEPSKCEYFMKVQSPAVCDSKLDASGDNGGSSTREEL
ncbi:hypothetical protein HDU81_008893 [Chytriomyces hyalinus]|nr:hypothetical protein HDU81_008893 [Chytriomyces hyalinus]